MVEPRADMLPDNLDNSGQSLKEPVVSEDENTQEREEQEIEDIPVPKATQESPEVKKGDKTPDNLLLKSLREEREKRRDLEEKIKEYESSASLEILDDDSLSIEGKMLKKQLETVNKKLSTLEKERENERVYSLFPQLKDKTEEFEEFRKEYSGFPLEKIAKLFVVERGLTEIKPRKGLEKPTGGIKETSPTRFSAADIDRIRTTEPRRFIKLVMDGTINADDIR